MVASSSAIGSLFAVCGHNKETIAVADEGHIVFYSSKTMLKVLSQRVSDARLVGINAVNSVGGKTEGPQYHVHAVDSLGNYFVVDVATNYVMHTIKMNISTTADKASERNNVGNATKTVMGAQWTSVANSVEESVKDSDIVPTSLCVVLLTPIGVLTQHVIRIVSPREGNRLPFTKALHFPGPMTAIIMAVGIENGVILVGQRNRTWLWAASAASDNNATAAKVGAPVRHLSLPFRLMSAAVTPLANTTAFALGGDRGEIAYYPTAGIAVSNGTTSNKSSNAVTDSSAPLRFFSDQWHSTPLQALAFTEDGQSVLSGAGERALVSWSVSGTFARTRVVSSRREELAEGYLWKKNTEAKFDKKARFRVRAKKNGKAEDLLFLTSDIASIIIPHVHGSSRAGYHAASPFSSAVTGCYIVGVTGQIASMDLREQKVSAVSDGIRWSMTVTDTHADSIMSGQQPMQVVEWMGRPALLIVSAVDSEFRIVDPLTMQSLYTHHVRFNMETSLVNPFVNTATNVSTATETPSAATEDRSALQPFFDDNKATLARLNTRGTVGALLAAVADGGRTVFTYESLTHLGLDSVLRVWRYEADKQRHVEVQAIHNPHATEVLQMRSVTLVVPFYRQQDKTEVCYDSVTVLFTMDRLGVKVWRSVQLPKHETRSLVGSQRNFLHLGGVSGGANGEKEADAFLWRVVGSNRCASGRASSFELSDDGSVLLVADEVVRAYEVPSNDIRLAFNPNAPGRAYAVSNWELLFILRSPQHEAAEATDASLLCAEISSLRFISNGGIFPSVFARFSDGRACCWQADADANWHAVWSSEKVHSLLQATGSTNKSADGTTDSSLTLTYITEAADVNNKGSSMTAARAVIKQSVDGASPPIEKDVSLCELPKVSGKVQYVVLPSSSAGPSSSWSSSANSVVDGRVMMLDAAGVRFVPLSSKKPSKKNNKKNVELFEENRKKTSNKDARLDLYFKKTESTKVAVGEGDDNATEENAAVATLSSQQLVSKVLSSEAYAAPPMGLILSSLLAVE